MWVCVVGGCRHIYVTVYVEVREPFLRVSSCFSLSAMGLENQTRVLRLAQPTRLPTEPPHWPCWNLLTDLESRTVCLPPPLDRQIFPPQPMFYLQWSRYIMRVSLNGNTLLTLEGDLESIQLASSICCLLHRKPVVLPPQPSQDELGPWVSSVFSLQR